MLLRAWMSPLYGIFLATYLFLTATAYAINPIQIENARPGTDQWIIPAANATNTDGQIEGYASDTSVNQGGQISLFVNTPATQFNVDIYRMGCYPHLVMGTLVCWGGRFISHTGPLTGRSRPPCPLDAANGNLIDCRTVWDTPPATPDLTLNIPNLPATDPNSWVTGVYLAKLTALDSNPNLNNKQSYIIFVVRDDGPRSDGTYSQYLFQLSVATYQAYNPWGGLSLYSNQSPNGTNVAQKVSFNRPCDYRTNGAGQFLPGPSWPYCPPNGTGCYDPNSTDCLSRTAARYAYEYRGFEHNMVRWLEFNNYDVSYITNVDIHDTTTAPAMLSPRKAFFSVGHDEYWSTNMRNNIDTARSNGLHLAFFSANSVYWRIRFEPSGIPSPRTNNRTIVCYKELCPFPYDPNNPSCFSDPQPARTDVTTLFRYSALLTVNNPVISTPANPEHHLIGVEYSEPWMTRYDIGDITVQNPSQSSLFTNVTFESDGTLKGVLGFEPDTAAGTPNLAQQFKILASSSYYVCDGDVSCQTVPCTTGSPTCPAPNNHCLGPYPSNMTAWKGSGNSGWVFATGTAQWSWGLDNYGSGANGNPSRRVDTPAYGATRAAVKQITQNLLACFTGQTSLCP